ncbi:MAG: peroxiredoxin [Polyangiaceae bacterium]|nr:peroxiredoxin [Polyangiaceae bacterium]
MSSLKVGDRAPEISAQTNNGTPFVLSEQTGLCTVVYFFPKAFTPHCTKETRTFTDNFNELLLAGANLVGVSTDEFDTQCRFAGELRVPFPLIADADKRIAKAYGVLWPIVGLARRYTFVIGPDMTIEAIFHHELDVQQHRDDVLLFVHDKFEAQRPPVIPQA